MEQVLERFRRVFRDGIVWIQHLPAREAVWADFPSDLDPRLRQVLEAQGIRRLYAHQAEAWRLVRAGHSVVIVTPTASGKTLCYNLPVLQRSLEKPRARAMYLFPTKALAQDQKAILRAMTQAWAPDLEIQTYDGDTPEDLRAVIRERSHIVLTNPDMLHTGILPHHVKWAQLFENLEYVVIDELHAYRGVFGSHVALVLRRLQRVCEFYGSRPVFITTSATIANPVEHAERLLGIPVVCIDQSGAPQGERYFVLYNPPVVDPTLGLRRSFIQEACRIAEFLIRHGLQTIVFAPSRLYTEIALRYLRERLAQRPDRRDRVRGYRGGYLPQTRRAIETALRAGEVVGVVSTNALELGVDIGSLDASVLASYPGTMASVWQQAGRAGRRDRPALHVFVASHRAIDQYLVTHPDYFFGRTPEQALIDPWNLFIFLDHLKCAAFELAFQDDETFAGQPVGEWMELLEEDGWVHRVGRRWHWIGDSFPADAVSLRTVTSDNFVVVDTSGRPRVIAEVDFSSALTSIHPKAIYLCEGQTYYVDELDFQGRKAYVRPVQVDYFTDAIRYTHVDVLDVLDERTGPGWRVAHGEVKVQEQVVGFKKIKFGTHENVGSGELSLPEYQLHTAAFWLSFERSAYEAWSPDAVVRTAVLQGLGYLLHQMAPLVLMADVRDLAVAASEHEPSADEARPAFAPRIYLYEVYPGGVGLAPNLFRRAGELFRLARDVVERCACVAGCPSCIGPRPAVGTDVKGLVGCVLADLTAAEGGPAAP